MGVSIVQVVHPRVAMIIISLLTIREKNSMYSQHLKKFLINKIKSYSNNIIEISTNSEPYF